MNPHHAPLGEVERVLNEEAPLVVACCVCKRVPECGVLIRVRYPEGEFFCVGCWDKRINKARR